MNNDAMLIRVDNIITCSQTLQGHVIPVLPVVLAQDEDVIIRTSTDIIAGLGASA
jgi:hypothetical protein